jgi:tRNA pseudouridine38-40 synthase
MEKKHRYKLIFSYVGTNYSGYQKQPNANTIQEEIEKAISLILKEKIQIVASGRTDAKVHAQNQAAHFDTTNELNIFKAHKSLNGVLPTDIYIKSIEKTNLDFHARYSSISKTYIYHIRLKYCPFLKQLAFFPKKKIDVELFKKSGTKFIGKKNFTTFSNEAKKGSCAINPIREIYRLDIKTTDEDIFVEIEANGFLYKMVRNIIGTMLAVSTNKISLQDIDKLFIAKDRTKAPMGALAHGLFLKEVNYSKIIN